MTIRPTQRILEQTALREWDKLLHTLPPDVAARARDIQFICTSRPNAAQVEDGIEDDCLGLFTGPALDEPGGCASLQPPEMFLFLSNLWDYAEGHKPTFREEVRRTLLHELGHYLGFEEDDLKERGMD